eukprot:UN21407
MPSFCRRSSFRIKSIVCRRSSKMSQFFLELPSHIGDFRQKNTIAQLLFISNV